MKTENTTPIEIKPYECSNIQARLLLMYNPEIEFCIIGEQQFTNSAARKWLANNRGRVWVVVEANGNLKISGAVTEGAKPAEEIASEQKHVEELKIILRKNFPAYSDRFTGNKITIAAQEIVNYFKTKTA